MGASVATFGESVRKTLETILNKPLVSADDLSRGLVSSAMEESSSSNPSRINRSSALRSMTNSASSTQDITCEGALEDERTEERSLSAFRTCLHVHALRGKIAGVRT